MDCWNGQPDDDRSARAHFMLGEVRSRSNGAAEQLDGDDSGVNARHNLSVDGALFPFMHPGGQGSAASAKGLSELLQQRVQQLFSPFTLVKEYLLIMFQVGRHISSVVVGLKLMLHPLLMAAELSMPPPLPLLMLTYCPCSHR